MSRKRHLRAKVRKKAFGLPKAIQFIRDGKFVALIEDRSAVRTKWTVEVNPKAFRLIHDAQELLQRNEEEIWDFRHEIKRLEDEVSDQAQRYGILLRRYNEQARELARFQKDAPRSPKSAMNALMERGTDLALPALSGGLAGVEKK